MSVPTIRSRADTGTSPEMILRAAAGLAAIAAIGSALYQVVTAGPPAGAVYASWIDYLREVLFLLYLGGSILAVANARRHSLAPTIAAAMIAGGYLLIGIGVAVGLAVREEIDWFFVVAGPGLLSSAAGFIVWAVWAIRRRVFPLVVAVLLGVGGTVAIIMSEFGTGVLIGGFWLYIAWRASET